MSLPRQVAYLGIGSNLGDRRRCLAAAREKVDALPGTVVEAVSPLYESPPFGGPVGQGNYLNAVIRVVTVLGPRLLLQHCQVIEASLGRVRQERWGARTLDIDLLLYDELTSDDPQLTLPHPRLGERAFVLLPLRDLAPGLIIPGLGRSVADLATTCRPQEAWRLAEKW